MGSKVSRIRPSYQQFHSRSESVERDGAEFFGQQGLDEEYGAGESQGVSLGLKALVVNKCILFPTYSLSIFIS